ncbi:exosome complex endonuclease 2/ribosomal RNA processing protein-like protein [Halenospora varia]|nr:exosome complex endonuclease 2/ribosomal RNA processing protein-like protein [Halenospora varia]
MPREVEPSQNEKQFFARALQENIRLDGRAFDQFRSLEVEFGEEYGVADVRLGKTRINTHITATVEPPFPDRPFEGTFTITTELSPMASPAFTSSAPTPTEISLSRLLEKTIRRSGALDTESLCLIAGSKVWSIRADVHVLSHDGNLVDAACISVMAALQHFRKPDTSSEGQNVTIYTLREREPVPLSLLHFPYCVTFSFYKVEKGKGEGDEVKMLIDGCGVEEALRDGSLTVGMNRHGEAALVKVKDISAFVAKSLEEDAKKRDKGGMMAELSAENDRVS